MSAFEYEATPGDTLVGGPGGDSMTGSTGDDILQGGDGNDILEGNEGNDFLDGGAGNDGLIGGYGSDVYAWGADSDEDLIHDIKGYDTVLIGATSSEVSISRQAEDQDSLVITLGSARLIINKYFVTGNQGDEEGHIERLVFADGATWGLEQVLDALGEQPPSPVPPGTLEPTPPPPSDPENLYLAGGAGNDTLIGGIGHDTLNGGQGDDHLLGEDGNDTYLWGPEQGHDTIEDSGGIDTLRIDAASTDVMLETDPNDAGALRVRLDGKILSIKAYFGDLGGRIEKFVFSDGVVWDEDAIMNILLAQRPDPVVEPDPVIEPNPDPNEDPETDPAAEGVVLAGGKANDALFGSDADDMLLGGAGRDSIQGGSGSDVLNGGKGTDVMTGGEGDDIFVFAKKADLGTGKKRDVIVDFETGVDIIDLGQLDANTATRKNDAFKVLLKGKEAFTKAGQLRYDAKTGILSGNTDKDAAAEFQILLKNKPKGLDLDDFVL